MQCLLLLPQHSKRSVVHDLTRAKGRAQLQRLVRHYDVVIAGETAGQLAARGIGFEQLRAWNDRVILTTVSGFGSDGPHSGYAWSHLIACATGGWAGNCGFEDREPLQAGGAITETLTGAFAAAATLLAVLGRRAHGHGELVDISAQIATLDGAAFPTLRHEYLGNFPVRNSKYAPGPSFILPALDGYIGVNSLTGPQWTALCDFLGQPDLASDPQWAGRERLRRRDEIAAIFGEAVRERTAEETFHDGEAWRVPFGLVPTMAQIPELLPHKERGFFVDLEHPRAGTVAVPGVPFRSTVTDSRPVRPPLLGEHNAELTAELDRMDRAQPSTGAVATTDATVPSPLAGLKILDLTMFFSGPLATQIAADAGADVIKVESVQRIDGWRASAAFDAARPWEHSPNWNWVNRNKRGITLNLADPQGVALVKSLIVDADVIIENYTPRVMGNFGLDYATVREINPRIIMMSLPGFGSDVSWRDYVAFGMSTEEMSGMCHLTGYAGGPPMFTGMNGGDPFVGVIAATVMAAALHHRETTGEGQFIDLSQVEACTLFVGDAVTGWTLAGADPGRVGNTHPTRAPYGIYPCRDDNWVAIECQTDAQWATLAPIIGHPEWCAETSPLATTVGRLQQREKLDAAIAAWTQSRGHIATMDELQSLGVPAGAVMMGTDLLADPHLAATNAFIEQDRPDVGIKHYPRQPYTFRFATPVEERRAPLLGEHTNEVLQERLGLTPAQLAELEREDIIGTVPLGAR